MPKAAGEVSIGSSKGSCRMSADAKSSQWISSGNPVTHTHTHAFPGTGADGGLCVRLRSESDSGETERMRKRKGLIAFGISIPVATALNPLHIAPSEPQTTPQSLTTSILIITRTIKHIQYILSSFIACTLAASRYTFYYFLPLCAPGFVKLVANVQRLWGSETSPRYVRRMPFLCARWWAPATA